ncbi:MAG: EAL domain-containing protein [Epsilonproteobacteria bacterium]|nr:EAL domain-containing protein [Campylobacterota bacterium]
MSFLDGYLIFLCQPFYGIYLIFISLYGVSVYRYFSNHKMNEEQLRMWYTHLSIFMYLIFSSWTVIFALNIQHSEYNLHYIAIFTELGAAVVASTLLVSDKKLFVPILVTLMLPLVLYFFLIGTWFGYVLSVFSLIFLGVLLYAAYNTNHLIRTNYYQAQHDMLTGLYNRRYFMEYMEPLHRRLLEKNKIAYMLLIDLDHFKTINDSLGHEIGDKLLTAVSERLKTYCKDKYILARLGGDEFILVSDELDKNKETQEEAHNFALRLLDEIRRPYTIDTHHLHISASIGLHELENFSLDSSNFIKEVDIAMYEAKSKGRDGVIVFNKDLSERVERHLEIEQRLHQTLNGNRLKVYYQPQFDCDSNIVGCEALVRWFDDDLGVLSPDEFIPIAENTGLILELGSYVLHETFKVLHSWNEEGHYLQNFAINISIRQLLYEPFIEEVEVLMKYYFSKEDLSQKIIFEITEHVFSQDMDKVVKTMKRLQKSGITFSIDDFGTGYSSLSYLQELPIGEVKIDKAFIAGMGSNGNSEKMIGTIISIAKNFNLKIVSEGVEEESQFEALQAYDCDIFQGFYFDEALSKEAFELKYFKD